MSAFVPTVVPVLWHPAMPPPLPGPLVFHSDREGRHRLFTVDTAGRVTRLTDGRDHNDEQPVVSPDGRHVAFSTTRFDHRSWDIAIWDLSTRSVRRVTTDIAFERHPAWHPNGDALLFSSEQDGTQAVFRARLGDGRIDRVWAGPDRTLMPAVSPDGRWLAYVSGTRDGLRVFVRDLASGKARAITPPLEAAATPRWSPEGRRIAFTRFDSDGTSVLAIASVDSGEIRVYPIDGFAAVCEPAWSPDGRSIAAAASPRLGDGVDWDVIVLEPGPPASAVRVTHGPAHDRAPSWMLR